MPKNKHPWRDHLDGFSDPADKARAMRASGLDCYEMVDLVESLTALEAGPHNRVLAATHGAKPMTRKQRRAAKKAQKRYDRARARPTYAHLYGDASLAPEARGESKIPEFPPVHDNAQNVAGDEDATSLAISAAAPALPAITTDLNDTPPGDSILGGSPFKAMPMIKTPAEGEFDLGLASGIYEAEVRRAKAFGWEPPERPAWYVPCPPALGPNPFAKVPARTAKASILTAEQTGRLFDAISFAMWRYGQPMNVHVVILWESFGVYDHEDAARHLGVILNRATKWAEVDTPGEMRQRRRQRTGEGFPLLWVYVHEASPLRGFHSHVLLSMPMRVVPAFRDWLWSALKRRTRNQGLRRSLRVIAPSARDEGVAVRRAWGWFRYIVKQTDPNAAIADTRDAPLRPLRDVLKPWGFRTPLPVTCAKLCGCSQNIGTKARLETAFRSELREGDLTRIYSGWEMEDGRQARLMEEWGPSLAR